MQKKVKELFETMQGVSGLVGGAVALIRNGKVDTWFFGHSDRETGLPVSEETYFDIASCSKSFTAMTAVFPSLPRADTFRFTEKTGTLTPRPIPSTSPSISFATRSVSTTWKASRKIPQAASPQV
jgi:hypothetical protein